jgi:hypothetical protein
MFLCCCLPVSPPVPVLLGAGFVCAAALFYAVTVMRSFVYGLPSQKFRLTNGMSV